MKKGLGKRAQTIEKRQQIIIGFGIFGGLVMLLCAGAWTFMSATSSVLRTTMTRNPTGGGGDAGLTGLWTLVGIAWIFISIVLIIASLAYGIHITRNANVGTRRVVRDALVIARFAATNDGLLYTDPNDIEMLHKPKFIVRLQSEQDGSVEYETNEIVFWHCGEGMRGTASVQGRWIGSFTPHIGAGQGIENSPDR